MKDAAPSISAPLTVIINLSISSAVLPEEWKYARVVPLYKDGDKKCMDNYRPISVLPVASKILERAVQIQLLQHLDKSSQLVINYVIMTSQCAQCTSKIHTIKKTGILTIVILCRYNNCNIGAETRRKSQRI